MPAQDQPDAGITPADRAMPVLLNAETMLQLNVCHPWLFRCAECGCPVLVENRQFDYVCGSCGMGPLPAVEQLPKRSRDEILVEINELISESWVSG